MQGPAHHSRKGVPAALHKAMLPIGFLRLLTPGCCASEYRVAKFAKIPEASEFRRPNAKPMMQSGLGFNGFWVQGSGLRV